MVEICWFILRDYITTPDTKNIEQILDLKGLKFHSCK